jgi:hypothetical protein
MKFGRTCQYEISLQSVQRFWRRNMLMDKDGKATMHIFAPFCSENTEM